MALHGTHLPGGNLAPSPGVLGASPEFLGPHQEDPLVLSEVANLGLSRAASLGSPPGVKWGYAV